MVEPSHAIAKALGELLIDRNLSLATAESCTGGLVATTLCAAPDTPKFYAGGYIVFNDEAKSTLLGVKRETLSRHTAVSSEAVQQMAAGAMAHAKADVSIAISGYAGPEGGEDGTPAGTVWFAWQLSSQQALVKCEHFSGDAESVIRQAADYALAGTLLLVGNQNQK
ncbi:2-oxo-tetronate isomerase [Dryocola sp. LX212]